MTYKIFFLYILLIITSHISFGQTKINKPISKNSFGFDFSLSNETYLNASKHNNTFHFQQTNIKTSIITVFKYKRTVDNTFSIDIMGGYLKSQRKFKTRYDFEDKKNYVYSNYKANFIHTQYYLMVMPEIKIDVDFLLYIKAGAGISLNYFNNFKNGYKIIYGLDGNYKRVKLLPDLTQSRLSTKLALDIGTQRFIFNEFTTISFGARLFIDSPLKLKGENIYLYSYSREIYLGIMINL